MLTIEFSMRKHMIMGIVECLNWSVIVSSNMSEILKIYAFSYVLCFHSFDCIFAVPSPDTSQLLKY